VNKISGEIAEALFDFCAMSMGIVVSKPHGDSTSYDRVADWGAGLKRVQIKSTSFNSRWGYVVNTKSRNYMYRNSIDVMAIYVKPENRWYFMPAEDVTVGTMRISAKHDRYLENWAIFK
jgi:hypothetical protein